MLQKDIKIVGEFTPEYVFNNFVIDGIREKEESYDVETDSGVFSVYANSQRYILFHEKGCTCVKCGATATKAYLCDTGSGRAHFNFIVEIDGEDFLLTKDHVEAKSGGGANAQKNYVPMCQRCNQLKGALADKMFNYYSKMIKDADNAKLFNFIFKYEDKFYLCNKKKGKWLQPQLVTYYK